ncbi:PPE family protein [Mycobacterium lentiflavum]|uniref:PPE family protein n=1 Tax=Mycobacterium lentiflavum TaxID=141349 RepID=A0A0E3WCY8_MYCLN|nr:PPE family protein [Mycobacterium lentiflavum]ULP40880.1 PPE family protein [Mycobacterium lentiflavum]CQD17164.1 PPE family protein [Mycobacterium lentiflavum]
MVLDFAFLPPEINSALMYGGAGSGPLLAAAAAWDGLAADMWASASSFDSVVSGLASNGQWTGPSSESMTQAAAPYLQWLHTAAAHASMSAVQARVAATSYESAFAATVPPAAIAANRIQLMVLIATNILGQNTAAIAATEFEYMEMWLQDVMAMFGYHAGAQSVMAALPSISSAPSSLAGLLTTPLSTLAAQFTGALSSVGGQIFGPGFSSAVTAIQSALTQVGSIVTSAPVSSLMSVAQIGVYPATALPPMMALAQGTAPVTSLAGATNMAAPGASQTVSSTAPAMRMMSGDGSWGSSISASLGRARLVGAISVPPVWQGSTPAPIVSSAMAGAGASGAVAEPVGSTSGVPMPARAAAGDDKPAEMVGRAGTSATHVVASRPKVVPRKGA